MYQAYSVPGTVPGAGKKPCLHEVCISLNKQMNKQTNEIHTTADGIKWHGEKLSKAMKGIVGKPEEVGG